jgi:hypothetical protein
MVTGNKQGNKFRFISENRRHKVVKSRIFKIYTSLHDRLPLGNLENKLRWRPFSPREPSAAASGRRANIFTSYSVGLKKTLDNS